MNAAGEEEQERALVKTIGLLWGMSWESTLPYYRIINQIVAERLGGLHSARILLYSFDFQEIEDLQRNGRWREAGDVLARGARTLQAAGADFLVLCTNTMHKVAPRIEAETDIPLLHIADATAAEIKKKNLKRVGLLGTRFTMGEGFYKERLRERHGLEVVVPEETDRAIIDRIIYDELCLGKVLEASRAEYRGIARALVEKRAEGIILGCTEIAMLLQPADVATPLFDTTGIHARSAAMLALGETGA